MYTYSITKYKKYKTQSNDWTSISDIGKVWNGTILTNDIYAKIEDAYVDSIIDVLNFLEIESLKMEHIFKWKNLKDDIAGEVYKDLYTEEIFKTYNNINEEVPIYREQVGNIVRLLLREDIGGHLYCEDKIHVYIGYDLEMGIKVFKPIDSIRQRIEDKGLLVETL